MAAEAVTTSALSSWNPIFQGISHAVGVATQAFGVPQTCTRIQRVNALCVDLQAPGVQVTTTPQFAANGQTVGNTITGFLQANPQVQVAINANFSWYDGSGFEVGIPYGLLGLAVSNGKVVCDPTIPCWRPGPPTQEAGVPSEAYAGAVVLLIHNNGTATFDVATQDHPIDLLTVLAAVAGSPPPVTGEFPPVHHNPGPLLILSSGNIQAQAGCIPPEGIAARTGVGVDKTGRYLYLVAVEGMEKAQTAYGAAFYDLAQWLKISGAWDAINLDGGGSTVMARASKYGPVLLSIPYADEKTPGLQRPVGNFLGVIAQPLNS